MTNMNELRQVHMQYTQYTDNGVQFESFDLEPLREGELVKFDPENTGSYYNKPYDESRAVVGCVGRVTHVAKPYEALGPGKTYEEQAANSHMVRLSCAEVAWVDAEIRVPSLVVVKGGPTDWLPGLGEMD